MQDCEVWFGYWTG